MHTYYAHACMRARTHTHTLVQQGVKGVVGGLERGKGGEMM